MKILATTTPQNEDYKKENEVLKQQVAELSVKLNWYEEQFRLSQQKKFGQSSDKIIVDQISMFNEAEKEVDNTVVEPTVEEITYKRRKKQGQRKEMLENLPVEVREYKLSEDEMNCNFCNGTLHEMSVEIRREIEIIPAQVKVIENRKSVYACRDCDKNEISTPIITAKMPNPPIPKSIASASSIAFVMNQKYVESMPLYRLEKHFERLDIFLSRQTLSNWVVTASEKWLSIIYDRLHIKLLEKDVLYADETSLQVLNEDNREAKQRSYMWLYRTGRKGPPIILYEYQTTRASKHPKKFLKGAKGFLHVDGYSGYNDLDNITLVGCVAHARRKFSDTLKALPATANKNETAAYKGLDFCNQLYKVEGKIKDLSDEDRYETRVAESKPILDSFYDWLKSQKRIMLPKSKFGQAVNYCLNQWDKLNNFLQDGRLEIDNNRSERSIKPFVIGRKNWIFSNTSRGAKASSIIYSIVETAKENGLKPFEYLKYLFEQMPNVDITDMNILDALLPYSNELPDKCKVIKKKFK